MCPRFLLPGIILVIASQTQAAPQEDFISDLPGLSWKPNFKQYSGYLKGSGTKKLHYWFVESSGNPKVDPVVLWMNGGPGCSSLHGFLTEHGPFRVNSDGSTLQPFPFAWNQLASMIYLEAPAGVGFSYSDDKNYTTDDDEVSESNHLALQDFFQKFPEYSQNDFYITGESYGGIYVPTLVSRVLDDPTINLKGFAVGNGLSDDEMNDNSIVYFAYYHGLLGDEEWINLLKVCCPGKESSLTCNFVAGMKNPQCSSELQDVQNLVWRSGLNVYNLYANCPGGAKDLTLHFDEEREMFVTSNFGWPFMFLKSSIYDMKQKLKTLPANKLVSTPPCTNDTNVIKYLNSASVKKALHISKEAADWDICSTVVGNNYKQLYSTVKPQYLKAVNRKLRVLVYNGDIDMACNFLGDEWFVDSLNLTNPQERRKWYYKEADGTTQVAGFVKTFDFLTFATIRGAGHMVPTDKPRPALEMFTNFIQNKPFKYEQQ
uniref:Carboxypeptidase n=1 Tax=Biomphalaria glabrata TaxID=6526 RepID=A0A2C9M6B3_BIOGL